MPKSQQHQQHDQTVEMLKKKKKTNSDDLTTQINIPKQHTRYEIAVIAKRCFEC